MKLKRAIGVEEFLSMKIKTFDFTGLWRDAFGTPEATGIWLIWGDSANGKTSFALQLAKNLTRFGKVLYNSLEEATSKAMQVAFKREKMQEVKGKIFLVSEDLDTMDQRLKNRKSPDIVFIDSAQYTGLTKKQFVTEFKDRYPGKLIIFISHGTDKEPEGALARAIKFEANLKICVSRFIAHNNGRSQGTTNKYVINHEKAAELN